jgi:hypothetical protein
MLPYPFREVYFQVTGEYENDMRLIFIEQALSYLLVFDYGCFYLVNKPAIINLEGYQRAAFSNSRPPLGIRYLISGITDYFVKKDTDNYSIHRIFEDRLGYTYIELNDALIKIGMYFSTAAGQQVRDFSFSSLNYEPALYSSWLQEKKTAKPVEIFDLRFT